jgi:hypothetical protein
MDIKSALEKEIQHLESEILKSYEFAEKHDNISIGKLWRLNTKDTIASYKRIINSLNEESKG